MKSNQSMKRGAVGKAPVGLVGLASKILARAFALLLIMALFGGRAWAITGGEVDTRNIYSNVGALVWQPPDGSAPMQLASGILIHPRVFLTAGHVTIMGEQADPNLPQPVISFGADAFDPSTWLEIEAFITHANYREIAWTSQTSCDVGVIILKEPIYDLPLAKLPYAGYLDDLKQAKLLREPRQGGVPFEVAGYGTSLDWSPPVDIPSDGWRRFADSDYLNVLPGWLHLLQNLAAGNGGTGFGDSGGPAFWVEPDGTRVVVGITSWGDPNNVSTGFYWRVDIPETLEFIDWVINTVLPSLP